MPNLLANSVLLIAGSTGIAEATAELAARDGARLFIVSKTEANCRGLAERLRGAGAACGWLAGDLSKPETCDEAVRRCVADHGRLDAVYNAAGGSGRRFGDGPIHECPDEAWRATMEMNASPIFFMCRAAIRQMLAQPPATNGARGAILNMASVLAFSPRADNFATHAYAASKGAAIALTKSMAAYYAPMKIRVNAIAPALVRTPMSRRAQSDPAILELMKSKQPLAGDLIEAEDVARASLFLLGPDAAMITGQVLLVDAGWDVSG